MGVLIFMLPRRWWIALLGVGLAGVVALSVLLSDDALHSGERIPGVPGIVNRALQTSIGRDKDRLYLWEAAWLGIREHPWIGVGLGNERYTYEAYRQVVSARHDGYTFTNRASAGIHNIYLHVAYTLGWPGLALYLALHVVVAWWCVRGIRAARGDFPLERGLLWGALGGLAGLAAASAFQNYFLDAEVQNAIVITMALALYAGRRIVGGSAAAGSADPPGGASDAN
jgi:O-antigen ligase